MEEKILANNGDLISIEFDSWPDTLDIIKQPEKMVKLLESDNPAQMTVLRTLKL